MIMMNQIWDDSIAFVRRESALLIPLALATIYVADVMTSLAARPSGAGPIATISILAAAMLSIAGQLAIVSLVLRPASSVGEALVHGLSRLGKVIVVALLLGLVLSLALVPVIAGAVASGINLEDPDAIRHLPGWMALIVLIVLGVMIWLGIRLALMNVLIVDRNPGLVDAVKGGFALTRGISARLFLVAALYGAVLIVTGSAVRFVAGSAFALIGTAVGSPFAGAVLTALVAGLVTTALSLISTVFLATLYRHVSAS